MSIEQRQIAVIGGRKADKNTLLIAETVGNSIATRGWQLVTGGLGGVMKAASKGAYNAGGTVIGILPSQKRSSANPYITVPIATNLGVARNFVIASTADAAIAIGGSYGTLSEIAFFLQFGKPVVRLSCSWEIEGTILAESPREAIAIIEKELCRIEGE